jgi:hypothetical protein
MEGVQKTNMLRYQLSLVQLGNECKFVFHTQIPKRTDKLHVEMLDTNNKHVWSSGLSHISVQEFFLSKRCI